MFMSRPAQGPRIMFIFAEGCGACEEAKPHLARWMKRHPEIPVVWFDVMKDAWTDPSWQINATPTYVVQFPGHQRVMWEGALKEKQIDQLLQTAKNRLGIR
jgi:thiol-disulfide isomerase/thioredoxin